MVQHGKWANPPGGSSLKFGSTTYTRISNISSIARVISRLEEPTFFQKILFWLFGVKDCTHFIIVEQYETASNDIKEVLDEHSVQYRRFGIDKTAYFCFDLSAVNHMRIIQ